MALDKLTLDDLKKHSDALNLGIDEGDLPKYLELVDQNLEAYRALDEIDDTVLNTDAIRADPRIPTVDENPHNAWASIARVESESEGVLTDRTVVLKDNICLAGAPLFNGTKAMNDYRPQSDATVVSRVLNEGATILGKAHCEYLCASGGSHTNAWGPVLNPHDVSRMSGGSSSGCAVLIASGQADMAIGGDQGGSIRIPASFTGIVGMKPTHGLVPYTGIVPIEPTMDHAGPMTRTVTDNALMLNVLAGSDGLDPRQKEIEPIDYLEGIEDGVEGLSIGLLAEGFSLPISEPDVDASVRAAASELVKLGAEVSTVSIPEILGGAAVWVPISAEGAVSTMLTHYGLPPMPRAFYPIDLLDETAKWRSNAAAMPPNAKVLLMLGEHMNKNHHGRYFAKAQNFLLQIKQKVDDALQKYDLLMLPTTPMKAPIMPDSSASIEEVSSRAFEPLTNTAIFNSTGHPALTVPCGINEGLPIGLMMVGRHFDEATIYRAARALEKHLNLDLIPKDSPDLNG